MDIEYSNRLQRAIVNEWMEGVEKDSTREGKRKLRVEIGKKYGISVWLVHGIITFMAAQGLERRKVKRPNGFSSSYEPINYAELVNGLKQRVATLERQFSYVLEGIERIAKARQSYEVYVQQLGTIGKRLKGRSNVVELEWPMGGEGVRRG